MERYYTETVYRYRVYRCLNDELRNPEKTWTLVYSSEDAESCKTVQVDQENHWSKFGDQFKVVDNLIPTEIRRPIW